MLKCLIVVGGDCNTMFMEDLIAFLAQAGRLREFHVKRFLLRDVQDEDAWMSALRLNDTLWHVQSLPNVHVRSTRSGRLRKDPAWKYTANAINGCSSSCHHHVGYIGLLSDGK
jgi:hypothetical protein